MTGSPLPITTKSKSLWPGAAAAKPGVKAGDGAREIGNRLAGSVSPTTVVVIPASSAASSSRAEIATVVIQCAHEQPPAVVACVAARRSGSDDPAAVFAFCVSVGMGSEEFHRQLV
jgi:hypothetical protein